MDQTIFSRTRNAKLTAWLAAIVIALSATLDAKAAPSPATENLVNDGHHATWTEDFQTLQTASDNFVGGEPRREQVLALATTNATGQLTVSLAIPDPDAREVAVDRTIQVHFSKPVDTSSVTHALTLVGPQGNVRGFTSASDDGHELYFKSAQDLFPGTAYTLVSDRVVAASGEAFPASAFRFTTQQLTASADVDANSASFSSSANASSARSFLRTGNASVERPGCSKGASVDEPCREDAVLKDGFWFPGKRNRGGHWRVNGTEPESVDEKTLSDRSIASSDQGVYGRILLVDGSPIGNVTVSVAGQVVQTDGEGVFVVKNVAAGHQVLSVDGHSASAAGITYGNFFVSVEVNAQGMTPLRSVFYLPRIHPQDEMDIPSPTLVDTVVTHPELPGLEIHIPAGTVIRDRHGHALTHLSIVPMPADRFTVPLPANFPIAFSIQPEGATVDNISGMSSGITVSYPYDGMTTATGYDFWIYDPDRSGWRVYANGVVSDDGRHIVSSGKAGEISLIPTMYSVWGPPPPTMAPPPGSCGQSCCVNASSSRGQSHSSNWQPPSGIPILSGDPVDCFSGLFIHQQTDLAIRDTNSISVTRTYRPNDTNNYAFGQGTSHSNGMYLYNPSGNTTPPEIDLVMPDGSKVPFLRRSGNLGGGGPGVWISTSMPANFYGALLTNNEQILPCGLCVTLKDGTTYVFPSEGSPSAPSYVQAIIDRFGNTTTFTYSAGFVSTITSPSGRFIKYTYNASNFVSQIADHTGRAVTYNYTGSQLTQVNYPDSTTEKYAYDTNGRMYTVTDRRGNIMVTNLYDANGRVSQQTLADGAIYHWSYTLSETTVVATDVTDSRNNVQHTTYDAIGYPLTVTKASGTSIAQTTTFVRGQNELITSTTDALNRTTTTTYDSFGNPLTKTYLYGTPNAVTYTYTYTPDFNDVATFKDPLGHITTYSYTNGCLTSIKDALSHSTTITCNAAGQPLVITDALSHATTLTYSGYDLATVKDALSRITTYSTDNLGRTISTVDPLGRETRVVYDVDDRVTQSVDALSQVTQISYDGNSNLTDVIDPNGGHTKYGYDMRNRSNSRTDALGKSESWQFDGEGNLQTYTDRKLQATNYQYDALNHPTLVTFADSSTITPVFDSGNRLTSIVDTVSGTINRSYDGFDGLLQEQTPQGTVNYTYDAAERRATMTPGSQTQIVYTFDNANRLTNIVQGSQSVIIGYDNANRRTTLTLPNGVVTTYGYDNADELTGLTFKTSGGTTLGALAYTYDAAGQRLTRTGSFASDLLATATTGTDTFDLNNRQTVWDGYTFGYDVNGDPTSNSSTSPSTTYTFDARHRLTQIVQGGSTLATFSYDTIGRRTGKTIGAATTSFLYDGFNPVQETQGGTTNAILTGLGLDERFARQEAAGTRYFLIDALGSTVALTDSTQAVQQTYTYEPYGEVTSTGNSNNSYQFAGRENDGTGFYYYRARYYSPTLKRFISEDPTGFAAGLNGYAYVDSSPINEVDPEGLAGSQTKPKPGYAVPAPPHIFPTHPDSSDILPLLPGVLNLVKWMVCPFVPDGTLPPCTFLFQDGDECVYKCPGGLVSFLYVGPNGTCPRTIPFNPPPG